MDFSIIDNWGKNQAAPKPHLPIPASALLLEMHVIKLLNTKKKKKKYLCSQNKKSRKKSDI